MNKEQKKFSLGLEKVLREMCRRVGARYEDVDFSDPEWFYQYEWTEEEEEDFVKWLTKELVSDAQLRKDLMRYPTSRKKYLQRFAEVFTANYGWRLKETMKEER